MKLTDLGLPLDEIVTLHLRTYPSAPTVQGTLLITPNEHLPPEDIVLFLERALHLARKSRAIELYGNLSP